MRAPGEIAVAGRRVAAADRANAAEYPFEDTFAGVAAPKGPKEDQMAIGHERTKEQLYRQAQRLGIKGRSKMNKGQLKAAVTRRSH